MLKIVKVKMGTRGGGKITKKTPLSSRTEPEGQKKPIRGLFKI